MQIAKPGGMVIKTYVKQENIAYVSPGNRLVAVLEALPKLQLASKVKDVAPTDAKDIDNPGVTQAGSGSIPTRRAIRRKFLGGQKPLVKLFKVTANVDKRLQPRLRWGMTGKTHIYYGRGPVGKYWFHKLYKFLKKRLQRVI